MKKILCTSIVLIILLAACSAPVQQVPPTTELSGDYGTRSSQDEQLVGPA